ncbi:MAG TPA: hypothetical protein ENL08_03250 [Bacteroidetes bacterium]|nr:hypothetical protein [Bacteroidota bacterium]
MRLKKTNWSRDGGWTFVEAMLSVVIMSIMVLGLTIVLMAFREHLDRSWSIRVMDQYGNDVIERLTHELRNAVDVSVRNSYGNTQEIIISYLDPNCLDRTYKHRWRADLHTNQIKVDNAPIDPFFPPRKPGRGESYQILQFTLTKFGVLTPNPDENREAHFRNQAFLNATYDIRFKVRYNRNAINPGERNWSYEKEYSNRVYLRNKNLPIRNRVD